MLYLKTPRLLLVMCCMLCAYTGRPQLQQNDIIYATPVPLTASMLHRHATLVQQLLDIRYTPQQLQKHYQLVQAYWETGDYNGIQAIQGNLQFAEELNQLPQDERAATISQLRSTLIINLIEDAGKAQDSRWYLDNYFAAHPPLLQGDIPFITETADALIDAEYFINRELKGIATQPLTAAQRSVARKQLTAAWPGFDYDTKKQIMNGISKLSLVALRWKKIPPSERIALKVQYAGEQYLTNTERSVYQQAMLQQRQSAMSNQWGVIQQEMNFMKQSTDIIMGRGIKWNPSANRYEQEGGIVTEYW